MVYYAHHYGWDPNERDKYLGHPYFQSCADFCERWDQSAFDDGYATEALETFEPMVREVFARKAHDPAVLQPGVVKGLPAGSGGVSLPTVIASSVEQSRATRGTLADALSDRDCHATRNDMRSHMRFSRMVNVIGVHTGGELNEVVTGGVLTFPAPPRRSTR